MNFSDHYLNNFICLTNNKNISDAFSLKQNILTHSFWENFEEVYRGKII